MPKTSKTRRDDEFDQVLEVAGHLRMLMAILTQAELLQMKYEPRSPIHDGLSAAVAALKITGHLVGQEVVTIGKAKPSSKRGK